MTSGKKNKADVIKILENDVRTWHSLFFMNLLHLCLVGKVNYIRFRQV